MQVYPSRLCVVLGILILCQHASMPVNAQLGVLGRLRPVDYTNPADNPTTSSRVQTTPPASTSTPGELPAAAARPGAGIDLAATAAATDSPLLQGLLDSSASSGSTGSALPGATNSPVLRDGPTGDCAEPTRVNLDISLAEAADVVITGMVVAAGPAKIICAPTNSTLQLLERAGSSSPASWTGPDLLVNYAEPAKAANKTSNQTRSSDKESANVVLVSVQCVHKGALACRRNSVDARLSTNRCVVAVKIPPQPKADGKALAPCDVTSGFRYMMLLSTKPAAGCDGAYTIAHQRIVDSVRPHLGMSTCSPYPRWPSQSTSADGEGLAGLLSSKCPGAADPKPANCSGVADPCRAAQCPQGAAITCVPKSCEGSYMAAETLVAANACSAMFFAQNTGLPVSGCDLTVDRLNRQARQSQKRLDLAAGKSDAEVRGVDASGMPRLVNPDRLFPNFGRGSGGGDTSAAQGSNAGANSAGSLPSFEGQDYSSSTDDMNVGSTAARP